MALKKPLAALVLAVTLVVVLAAAAPAIATPANLSPASILPLPTPNITSVTPTHGVQGATVTVAGSNFGATQGASDVKFGGSAASVSSWSATSITCQVPGILPGATTVAVIVGGKTSNTVAFTVDLVQLTPNITGVTPTHGFPGATVTVAGNRFGITQGTSVVKFGGSAASVSSWSNTSITCKVPSIAAGATTVALTVDGVTSNAVAFTVDGVQPIGPEIASLTPTHGLPGATVVIAGSRFGATQGTSVLKFGGSAPSISSWSNTSITCKVPSIAAGATTVVVFVGGRGSNAVAFTVDGVQPIGPEIASLTPTHGLPGATVVIAGSRFGATQGTSVLKFGGSAPSISSWSNTSITCKVPSIAAGATTVVVFVGGRGSNAVAFTVDGVQPIGPEIASLTPTHGLPGATVVIAGSRFGATQGTSVLKFGTVAVSVSGWSATSITCQVPVMAAGATTVTVTVGGVASNAASFTVDAPPPPAPGTPQITSVTPAHGAPGASVTVAGGNFGATQGASVVEFGTVAVSVSGWSATSITCQVPVMAAGATTVTVTVGGVASNAASFTVDVPPPPAPGAPQITSVTPAHGLPGATVTVAGSGFGATQGTSSAKFGSTAASVSSWSATSITCAVPATAAGATTVIVTVGGMASNAAAFTVDASSSTPSVALKLSGLSAGTLRLGRRVTAECAVTPTSLAGERCKLTVQKKKGARWVRVARLSGTIGPTGTYIWKYRAATRGSYRMQSTLVATTQHAALKTPWRGFRVQ